jgi:hypothetical protein
MMGEVDDAEENSDLLCFVDGCGVYVPALAPEQRSSAVFV